MSRASQTCCLTSGLLQTIGVDAPAGWSVKLRGVEQKGLDGSVGTADTSVVSTVPHKKEAERMRPPMCPAIPAGYGTNPADCACGACPEARAYERNETMSQQYSDPTRESDAHALPDLEVFELTAAECAAMDEDLVWEYMKRREFALAAMNGKVREEMLDCMVAEQCISGGWFYQYCFPGCLPDSDPMGPYPSYDEALAAAREDAGF
jgi:hypothetical protein